MNVSSFLDKNPFVRIIIPFILGIICCNYRFTPVIVSLAALCVFVSIAAIAYSRGFPYKSRWMFGPVHFSVFFALGQLMFGISIPPEMSDDVSNHKFNYRACVTSSPSEGLKAYKVDLRIEAVNVFDKWQNLDAKVVGTIMKDSLARQLKAGQTIEFSSRIDSLNAPKNPFGFDYSQYLQLNGVQGSLFLNSGDWRIEKENVRGVSYHALNVRQKLVGLLEKSGLSGNELGLASTLVLGYKNNIDSEVKQAYMNAGAMHVLAVSGMHVGIVCAVLNVIMMLFGGRKCFRIKRVLIVLLLWAYAFITGLSPSVLRATVMFTAFEIGRLVDRETSTYNSLAVSAMVLLCIDPNMLFMAGFQLSYVAVIGIVFFQPRIVMLLPVKKMNIVLKYIWELTAVSISAQISTFPLCLFYFERTPVYFWLSNMVVSPGAVVMISLTLLLLAVSPFASLSNLVGFLTSSFAKLMNFLVMSIANLPHSTIENTNITVFQSMAVALAIVAVSAWMISKNCNWLIGSLSALLLFFMPFTVNKMRNLQTQALCVYYSPKQMMSQFVSGCRSYWMNGFGDSGRQANVLAKGGNIFWSSIKSDILRVNGEVDKEQILSKNGFFVFDNISGLMVQDSSVRFDVSAPLTLDYLVVSGDPKLRARQMPKNLSFRNVVIDASVKPWVAKDWVRRYADCHIHDVRTQGAYICRW